MGNVCRVLVAAGLCIGSASVARSRTPIESSAEARFQLDFHVPEAALMAMLPPGFTLNVATQDNLVWLNRSVFQP